LRKLLRTHFWSLIGSPAVSGSTTACKAGIIPGSFFDRRAPATRPADAIRRVIRQRGVQFRAATPDGFLIHAGDLRQQTVTAVTQPLGLQGHKPTALVLIQAVEHEQQLAVSLALRMIGSPLTQRALTVRYVACGHGLLPS
jgi:hypothetical protein